MKHVLYSTSFSLQNVVCFIMLTSLVPVLFTFYIQNVLKLKKNNSVAKGLINKYIEMHGQQNIKKKTVQNIQVLHLTKKTLLYIKNQYTCLIISRSFLPVIINVPDKVVRKSNPQILRPITSLFKSCHV